MNETNDVQEKLLLKEEKSGSNIWTKISAVGQITSCLSNSYLYGGFVDLCFGIHPNAFGLSYYGWGVGGAIGLFSTACTTICEYSINSINQSDTNIEGLKKMDMEYFFEDPCQSRTHFIFRNIILGGDLIDNIGYRAAGLVFAIDLATGSKLSRYQKLGVQIGTSIFGLFASVADFQTSKNNLELKTKINAIDDNPKLFLNYDV